MQLKLNTSLTAAALFYTLLSTSAQAAISLDRTRVIFDGSLKSVSLSISNDNKQLPYLAQGWIEDAKGEKITSPLTVLPPVQRLEPGAKSQLKIQGLPAISALPQDRESLFYFNLREIPPRSEKSNTLQIALQTRIKMFYRPKALLQETSATPWQESMTLTKVGDRYRVNNPTGYFIILIDGRRSQKETSVAGFEPLMIEPHGQAMLKSTASALGSAPVLSYINDYGGRPLLQFSCNGSECSAKSVKENS